MNKYNRLVILGGGFISTSIKDFLNKKGKYVKIIRKKNIDLTKITQVKNLSKIIKKTDNVFFAAALAPVKNKKMFEYNIKMADNIIKIFKKLKFSKFIYLSSDAVYSDTFQKITENSKTFPKSLHGQMHLKREKLFRKLTNNNLIIIRPTLVYGPNDPHNGYGPNKFIRYAQNDEQVVLFGKGEERRDHIHVDNVAEIVFYSAIKKISGIINAVSGNVISFYEIAKNLKKILFDKKSLFLFFVFIVYLSYGFFNFDFEKITVTNYWIGFGVVQKLTILITDEIFLRKIITYLFFIFSFILIVYFYFLNKKNFYLISYFLLISVFLWPLMQEYFDPIIFIISIALFKSFKLLNKSNAIIIMVYQIIFLLTANIYYN